MPKVYAPNEKYDGIVGDVAFRDGVADVPDDSTAMRYFKRRGYGIGSRPEADAGDAERMVVQNDVEVEYPDPEHTRERLGSPLRDAAVNPKPEDFLPPINAGKAHPHSSMVVSPGIHAVGPAPLRPGEVYVDDVRRQEALEMELAKAVLIDGEPATIIAVEAKADENMGPLGLSDPGSVEMGLRDAAEPTGEAPAASASKRVWVDFAVARGMSRDEAEDLNKNDLQARLAEAEADEAEEEEQAEK